MTEKNIILFLIEKYLKGNCISDAKYITIVNETLSHIKNYTESETQIKALKNFLGPCTKITYELYFDILRKLYNKKVMSDSNLRDLLLSINDDSLFNYEGYFTSG